MNWTTQHEDITIDIAPGNSVKGQVPYLVSSRCAEIRSTGSLGDGLRISYKNCLLEQIPAVEIWINRFRSPTGLICIVELQSGIEDHKDLHGLSDKSLVTWINAVMEDFSEAIGEKPDFFDLGQPPFDFKGIVEVKFALSRLGRWRNLQPMITQTGVI